MYTNLSKYRHLLFVMLFAGYLLSVFHSSGIQLLQYVSHLSILNDFSHQQHKKHGHVHKLIKKKAVSQDDPSENPLVFFELIEKIEISDYKEMDTNTFPIDRQDNYNYADLNSIIVLECDIPPPKYIL